MYTDRLFCGQKKIEGLWKSEFSVSPETEKRSTCQGSITCEACDSKDLHFPDQGSLFLCFVVFVLVFWGLFWFSRVFVFVPIMWLLNKCVQ